MFVISLLVLCLPLLVLGHEYYAGVCPDIQPAGEFSWERFQGEWMVGFKMNSRSSCIRYKYSQDGDKRTVTEEKLLPVVGRFGVPSAVSSTGALLQTSSNPADMFVTWDTGVLHHALFSKMRYIVMDTDYNKRALVCSCQDLNLGFFAVNRRSCDFLLRLTEDAPLALPEDYFGLLNKTSEDLALDMRRVRQDDCEDLKKMSLDLGFVQTALQLALNIIV